MTQYYHWKQTEMLEISLDSPDDFLKVKETLTRMGIASKVGNTLYQSCHILHKQGKYYIVHFKELFLLDGKRSNIELSDIQRRNTIAKLLSDWGLCTLKAKELDVAPLSQVKIIPFKEKASWNLVQKYTIGNKKIV